VTEGVELQPCESGVRLRARVKPGSRRERLVGAYGGALKIEVNAPPEGGRANRAVSRLLAEVLELPRRAVTITHGTTSRDKSVVVAGLSVGDLAARLERAGIDVAGSQAPGNAGL
jgi:uncharacterized protein (TIGR00251 family)